MTRLTDETRSERTAFVTCRFGVADTPPRRFRRLKRASPKYTDRPTAMSHILTAPVTQKTSSPTGYFLLSSIFVAYRKSSRPASRMTTTPDADLLLAGITASSFAQ